MLRTILLLPVVMALCFLPGREGQAQSNRGREAALLLRILSYDLSLSSRVSGEVNVLVVYSSSSEDSKAEGRALATAINSLGSRTTVAGMPATASDHAYRDARTLTDALRSNKSAAVYVCDGLGSATDAIIAATRRAGVLSLTDSERAVKDGVSVGIVKQGRQVKLFVNPDASKAEGARFDAALLRLAQIVR